MIQDTHTIITFKAFGGGVHLPPSDPPAWVPILPQSTVTFKY